MTNLNIDYLAMFLGISDAQADGKISDEFFIAILDALKPVTYVNGIGRREIGYTDFLSSIAVVKPPQWIEAVSLWEYLGKSLASGIEVAED